MISFLYFFVSYLLILITASEVCGRIFDRSAFMQFFPLCLVRMLARFRENVSFKSEIAALKKNLKTFRIRSNLASTMLMSPTMTAKWVDRRYHRTRLWTPSNFMASLTMTFASKRIKVCNSSGHAWMFCQNEWKRLGNPSSWFSATVINTT